MIWTFYDCFEWFFLHQKNAIIDMFCGAFKQHLIFLPWNFLDSDILKFMNFNLAIVQEVIPNLQHKRKLKLLNFGSNQKV